VDFIKKKKKVGFYGNSCGSSETIVKDEVRKGFYRDQGVAAGLVRLHFHDCFVKVSNCANHLVFLYSLLSMDRNLSTNDY
jgi:hypothetical protein